MSNRVQTLPPTLGVKDPDVRAYLDALSNAWDHRNGITDKSSPDRFITAEEFKGLASQAIADTLSSALGTSNPAIGGGRGAVGDAIAALSDEIKRSLLYQILGTPYADINLSELQQKINLSVDKAQALFAQERKSRLTADEALTSQLTIQASQIGQNQAAITAETQTRVNKDNAIASAVNNIWAAIGGSSAVIQDGQLAQVTPSGSQATKWTQVQSEVIDPNTGQSKVASIRQDFAAFNDQVNNKFGSMYTVRAQVVSGGRTVVGGFGLSALDGPEGPTIDFGVRADRFWVAGTDGTADIPFIIKGGKVYMKTAFIENATIDTLMLGRNAVTIPYFFQASDQSLSGGSYVIPFDVYADLGPSVPGGAFGGSGPSGSTMVTVTFFMRSTTDAWGRIAIYLNGVETPNSMDFGVRVAGGGNTDMCMPVTATAVLPGLSGSNRIGCIISSQPNSVGDYHPFTVKALRMSIFGGKR